MYKFFVCCSTFLSLLLLQPVHGSSSASESSFDGESSELFIDDEPCRKEGKVDSKLKCNALVE